MPGRVKCRQTLGTDLKHKPAAAVGAGCPALAVSYLRTSGTRLMSGSSSHSTWACSQELLLPSACSSNISRNLPSGPSPSPPAATGGRPSPGASVAAAGSAAPASPPSAGAGASVGFAAADAWTPACLNGSQRRSRVHTEDRCSDLPSSRARWPLSVMLAALCRPGQTCRPRGRAPCMSCNKSWLPEQRSAQHGGIIPGHSRRGSHSARRLHRFENGSKMSPAAAQFVPSTSPPAQQMSIRSDWRSLQMDKSCRCSRAP